MFFQTDQKTKRRKLKCCSKAIMLTGLQIWLSLIKDSNSLFGLPLWKTNNVVSEQVRHNPSCTSTEAGNFGCRKSRNCTIRVAKTKALISFAVTAKLICAFGFAYADCWFSHGSFGGSFVYCIEFIWPLSISLYRFEFINQ